MFEAVALLGAIVFIVVVTTAILAYVRRRMRASMLPDGGPGFDLAELRRLKEGGQLSADEYDNLVQTLYADSE